MHLSLDGKRLLAQRHSTLHPIFPAAPPPQCRPKFLMVPCNITRFP
jgi:hypothetical protein